MSQHFLLSFDKTLTAYMRRPNTKKPVSGSPDAEQSFVFSQIEYIVRYLNQPRSGRKPHWDLNSYPAALFK